MTELEQIEMWLDLLALGLWLLAAFAVAGLLGPVLRRSRRQLERFDGLRRGRS